MAKQHHRFGSKISTNVRLKCCRFLSREHTTRGTADPVVSRHDDPQITPPHAGQHRLSSGTELQLRPVCSEDKYEIDRFFNALTPQSRQQRFLRPKDRLTAQELEWVTQTDPQRHWAWVAVSDQNRPFSVVAFAEAFRDPSGEEAEIAVAVLDKWQGQRLGAVLLAAVGQSAAAAGVSWLYGFTYRNNHRILTYGDHRDAIITPQGEDTVRLEFAVEKINNDLPASLIGCQSDSKVESESLRTTRLEPPIQEEL